MAYDYASYYNTDLGDHGAMVAAIAAGNSQGWARGSTIYNISPFNESGNVTAEDALDYVRYWHQTIKPINSSTGNKNPTIVNISWGFYTLINVFDITTVTHRGVTYTGPWTNNGTVGKTYQELGFSHEGAKQYKLSIGDPNYYLKVSQPIVAWQSDVEDLIAAGIHVVVAAGNDGLVQDVATGVDYNNNIDATGLASPVYYNRPHGAASDNSICVGSIDASSYAPGIDKYSNRGPAIDIMAPGSGIVTAINKTSAVAGSVLDSRSLTDRISIGNGTSMAAPQITGMLAGVLSDYGAQLWTPAQAKLYLLVESKKEQLVDYEAPFNLAGTPNRYGFYKEFFTTTTTTTTTSTSTTTTTTTTTTTSTTTSTTTTTSLYYPPAAALPFPTLCYAVPEAGYTNVVDNVAWYNFTVTSSMILVVDTLLTYPVEDTHIAVFDDGGDVLIENDDTGSIDLSYLEIAITPGRYWIAVGLFETNFNQRFRARSKIPLPSGNVCLTVYEKGSPFTTTTTTSTTTTSTTTSTTSTTTSTTSTTTAAPYPVKPYYPPNSTLKRSWCDNYTLWGLFIDQFGRNFSAIIQRFSSNCGYPPATSTTSSTTTTTTMPNGMVIPASLWDSTVTRLSILVNKQAVRKLPYLEPTSEFLFARGNLPDGVILSNTGVIIGTPVVSNLEYKFEQPIYVYSFISIINTPTIPSFYRQYSISVVTNGLYVPSQAYTPFFDYNNKTYTYTIRTGYIPTELITWKLKWGLLPPNSSLSAQGHITVQSREIIRPFSRSEFVPNSFVNTATNNDTTWNTWLTGFLTRAHDYDYQFVLELGKADEEALLTITVRIIHLKAPTYESWFTTNANTITVDPDQEYFLILTSEQDAPMWDESLLELGSIDNGAVSKKFVSATNASGRNIKYKVTPNSNSRLPQGLIIQDNGVIVGRTSFRTRRYDQLTVPPEDIYTFSIRAGDQGDFTFTDKVFTLKVNDVNDPGDNLYIRGFPTLEQRAQLNAILNNTTLFPNNELFRPTDPWWGRRSDLYIEFGVGLNKTDVDQYMTLIQNHHYSKELQFKDVNYAVIQDADKKVEYEIVYLSLIDPLLGTSPEHSLSEPQSFVDLSGSRTYYHSQANEIDLWYYKEQPVTAYYTLAPNTIYNMKFTIRDTVGYVDTHTNLIPEWAMSRQVDPQTGELGAQLGFVPIVIIAYVKPGTGSIICQRLKNVSFDFIKFEFDRYQLENHLTKHYDPVTKEFDPSVVTVFDNDTTTFDQGGTKIVDNVDYYVSAHGADKYIKFPKTGVFR